MPIVRLFSFFIQRLKLREKIQGNQFQISEKTKNSVLLLLAAQNGFVAELKARLWIYKGEAYQSLYSRYTEAYRECFLSDLGLL